MECSDASGTGVWIRNGKAASHCWMLECETSMKLGVSLKCCRCRCL